MALIRNLFVVVVLLTGISAVSWAARPSAAVLRGCALGKSTDRVLLEPIEFSNVSRAEHFWRGQDATLAQHKGVVVGYVGEDIRQGLVYAKHVFPTLHATPMNVPAATYREWLKRGVLDLSQPADWFDIREARAGHYLCVALNRSMSRGTPLLFVLTLSTSTHQLYFAEQKLSGL